MNIEKKNYIDSYIQCINFKNKKRDFKNLSFVILYISKIDIQCLNYIINFIFNIAYTF